MKALFIALQYLLPQHLLSRSVGWLAGLYRPVWLKNALIQLFIRAFKVDMSEAEEPDPTAYPTFNAFFTRALRPGARPLAEEGILCPADGTISQIGRIQEHSLIQAKGRRYSSWSLLGGDDERAAWYRNGHFATIYLSPRDYHRVHMPVDGKLVATRYVPGQLFSVNQVTADGVEALFARNERLVCHFETPAGPMAMVLVGAMIVAGIETVWAGQVAPPPRQVEERDYLQLPEAVDLARGAEMGRFQLGSTVILLFPEGCVDWGPGLTAGGGVRLGQALGRVAG
ncbi:MAG: phosphatidylserine decarboxylase [Haliea sp.]|nr:phosphatidylserine decarboxylase [Haliea sp.]|tara:strand:- start:37782 stop:38633 length:852 start_codon:yes stop_codon:yes gene_type:complete